MAYTMTKEERAERKLSEQLLRPKANRATREALAMDRRLGIAPQKKTRASRMLAAERRKAARGDAPSLPSF